LNLKVTKLTKSTITVTQTPGLVLAFNRISDPLLARAKTAIALRERREVVSSTAAVVAAAAAAASFD